VSREIDRRDFSATRISPSREEELQSVAAEVSDRLPGEHRVAVAEVDATTGNAALVVSESAPAEREHYVRRALEHVQGIGQVLSLESTEPAEYVADEHVAETSSHAVTVHLQQQYKGIPIFQATQAVRFAPDGALTETGGSSVPVTEDVDALPGLPVSDAALRAARHVAVPDADEEGAVDEFGEPLELPRVDLTGFEPRAIASFPNRPDLPTVLEQGPFGDPITASLVWFPLGDSLRLGWEVKLAMPEHAGEYRTIIDANDGEILYCRQLVQTVAARGNVFHQDGGGRREMTSFPMQVADYDVWVSEGLPAGFPDDWVESDSTVGNSVLARLDTGGPALRGSPNGQLTFDPADPRSDEQRILNLFYLGCYLHDYFYLLGFREADGNFQRDNFGRGGFATDRVEARAHRGAVYGTANMYTPVEGTGPVMNMGLVTRTTKHTALDATVVIHEFTHGVTNRLVGGPMNVQALEAPQSRGFGEGCSDYFACTIAGTAVVGSWVTDRAGGLRGFAYDSDYPDDFGDLGTGRYGEVHAIGEIWCAAALEMNRRIGPRLGVQLVVDALKLAPANPSFLQMRDAILTALEHKRAAAQLDATQHTAARNGIWTAFARFGMGPGARSIGASLFGIESDFELPEGSESPVEPEPEPEPGPPHQIRVEGRPNLPIPDDRPEGVRARLDVPTPGRIAAMTVSIDIGHPYRGDLKVVLHSPEAQGAVLHDRGGAGADDLIKTYATQATPELAIFLGQEARGEWTLEVADLEGRDVGLLRTWVLELDLEEA
jgi:extracellular elastinolytic metalloproteinase